jgi:hypothetical protein
MRLLRGVPGAVLWVLAAVIGLVGLLLCVTVILLPLGIPLVKLANRLFCRSVQLMLPCTLVHPVDELTKAGDKPARKVSSAASDAAGDAAKEGRKFGKSASDTVGGAAKKGAQGRA